MAKCYFNQYDQLNTEFSDGSGSFSSPLDRTIAKDLAFLSAYALLDLPDTQSSFDLHEFYSLWCSQFLISVRLGLNEIGL